MGDALSVPFIVSCGELNDFALFRCSRVLWSNGHGKAFVRQGAFNSEGCLLQTVCTYVQKYMQWRKWRNWRKIASLWRFELDSKSGPLEAGDFGEIGDFGKNPHACNGENGEIGEKSSASGDLNWMPKVAPWRLAILAKMAILAKLAILAKIPMHAAKMAKMAKNHQPLAI